MTPQALKTPEQDPFISTSEICEILRCTPITIYRRRRAERFPAPVQRGSEALYLRRAVYKAMGIGVDDAAPAADVDPFADA